MENMKRLNKYGLRHWQLTETEGEECLKDKTAKTPDDGILSFVFSPPSCRTSCQNRADESDEMSELAGTHEQVVNATAKPA